MYSCSWPDYMRETGYVNYTLTAQHCNIWRMYSDIQDSWDSVTGIVDWVGDFAGNATSPGLGMVAAAGPGGFNDPCVSAPIFCRVPAAAPPDAHLLDSDMLIIGNFGLSVDQAKAQMALWCIMAAPLMMGERAFLHATLAFLLPPV